MSYDTTLILRMGLSSYGATAGLTFDTKVVRTASGIEYREAIRDSELGRWVLRYSNRERDKWEELYEIFRRVQGRANSFRATDPLDYTATVDEGAFIATSVATEWQMVKNYSSYSRPITKPKSPVVVTGGGSVDYDTGIVTNGSDPGSWSGEFYVHVRFDTDEMIPRIVGKVQGGDWLLDWDDVPLVEVR